MPFDYRILTKERQKLYKLGLFTDVDMEVLDRYDNKKDVLIKLREGNAGAVELSLGYAEYEKFRGIIDLSYRNLWGMNRQASLRLELSSLENVIYYSIMSRGFWACRYNSGHSYSVRTKEEINIDTRETRYRLTRHTATAGSKKKSVKV